LQAKISFVGSIKGADEPFDRKRPEKPLRIVVGSGDVFEGLDIGIEGMKVGEKRRIEIPPRYGSVPLFQK
jgi:FK506-binding nuclear protein